MDRDEAARFKQVRKLFEASLELPPAARSAWLCERCEDQALRAEVESLLAADGQDEMPLEPPGFSDCGARRGERIGPWALDSPIGSGGMGTVWRARRADGVFDRCVAIKLIKRGMDTDAVLRRFARERHVLAALDHPGIARLLDGGATDRGQPYLVMEYVEGTALDTHCDARRLDVRSRLELLARICDAVQHAHSHRIVHRDLKPANIVVTAEGRPKLLDFGIAKILDPGRSTPESSITLDLNRPMTPGYASPEQQRGTPVTPASDVFGLGVVLFELLTGRRPYQAVDGTTSIERDPLDRPTPRPSSVVTRAVDVATDPQSASCVNRELLAARRGVTPRQLRTLLRGDLDAIVGRALEGDPERRYQDAGELRDDVERYLRGEPVQAHPEGVVYRTTKFVRRHRTGVATTAIVLFALATATVLSTTLWIDAERQRGIAERSSRFARTGAAFAALESADVVSARRYLGDPPGGDASFELRHLWARADRSIASVELPDSDAIALDLAPETGCALIGGENGTLCVVDLRTMEVVRTWRALGAVVPQVFLRADAQIAIALLEDHAFLGLDLTTGAEQWRIEAAGARPRAVAVSADWDVIACGYRDGEVELREPTTGRRLAAWSTGAEEVRSLAFRPARSDLAVGTADGRVLLFDTREPGAAPITHELGALWSMAFDPAGARLAVARLDGHVAILDLATGVIEVHALAPGRRLASVRFSADGSLLIAAAHDRTIRILTAAGELHTLLGHAANAECAAEEPIAKRIVSVGRDARLRCWPMDVDDVARGRAQPGWYMGLEFAADGERAVTSGGWPGLALSRIQVWDVATGRALGALEPDEPALDSVAIDRTGTTVATGAESGTVHLFTAADGKWVATRFVAHDAPVLDVAFSSDGRLIATASRDGTVGLFRRSPTLEEIGRLRGHGGPVASVEFSPDSRRLLSASWDGTARVWSVASQATEVVCARHDRPVWQAAFDDRAERIATASWDGTLRIWGAVDGLESHRLIGHSGRVYGVAFAPEGNRIASCSEDGTVRLWDPDTGEEVATMRGHTTRVDKVAFDHTSGSLWSLSIDGELRRWDAPAIRPAR